MTSIEQLAAAVLQENRNARRRIATAESCTGGMVAAALTAIAGSSDVVEAGFVTYSYAAKTQMLGVDPAIISQHGAVSAECAFAMAAGGLQRSDADVIVAITGIAGPGGGSRDKPVGLVHFARARHGVHPAVHFAQPVRFQSLERAAIRAAATRYALELLRPGADDWLASPEALLLLAP